MLRILILIIIFSGCASSERTKYQAYKKKVGGHQERVLEDNLRLVSFKANSYTKKKLAMKFAKFRAIEICQTGEQKLTHLLDSFDKTQSKTITRTSSSGYPSYYYSMSPFYNRFGYGGGYGLSLGYSSASGTSWDETLHFPDVEVIFECVNEVHEPQMQLREVPPDEMKHLVKDLRGGLQIEKLPKDSINRENFRPGDIIIRGNDERIQEIYQLLVLFHQSKNHAIKVEVLRDGLLKHGLTLQGVNVSDKILEAQNRIIKSACKHEDVRQRPLCK